MMTLEVLFMLLELSIMLLENIYSTGITHDDIYLQSSCFYSTGYWGQYQNTFKTVVGLLVQSVNDKQMSFLKVKHLRESCFKSYNDFNVCNGIILKCPLYMDYEDSVLNNASTKEPLLKEKAQYSWPPSSNFFRSAANIFYFFLQNKLP
jgi:hypothetical protein